MFCMWGSLLHLKLNKTTSDLWWDLLSCSVWLPIYTSNIAFPSSTVSNHLTNLVIFFIKIRWAQQTFSEGSVWSACLYVQSLSPRVGSSTKLRGLARKEVRVRLQVWLDGEHTGGSPAACKACVFEKPVALTACFSVHSSGKIKPKSPRDCCNHWGKGCDSVLTALVLVETLPSEVTKLLFMSQA